MAITATLRNKNTAPATAPAATQTSPAPSPTTPATAPTKPTKPEAALPEDIANAMDIPSSVEVVSESAPEESAPATGNPASGSNPTTGLATRPSATVNRYTEESNGGAEGDWDQDDIRLPQLKIVNGSGPLSQLHHQGTLLLADEVLWEPPKLIQGAVNPITDIVPIKLVKQFRENLTKEEMDDGVMPRIATSREDAENMGGTTRWINNEKPRWSPSARLLFLLAEPENCEHPAFTAQLDGKNYAACVYYASGTAYNESAKMIFNAGQVNLRENGKTVYEKKFWTFQVTKKKAGDFMVFVPLLRLTKREVGPDLRECALVLRGSRTAAASTQE